MTGFDFKTAVKFDLSGLEKLVEHAKEQVADEVAAAIEEFSSCVEADAKTLVPVKTGLLRDSIHTKIAKDGQHATVRTNAKTAPHGHLVHFGTEKMEGTPFLYQAVEAHPKAELAALIEEKIRASKDN